MYLYTPLYLQSQVDRYRFPLRLIRREHLPTEGGLPCYVESHCHIARFHLTSKRRYEEEAGEGGGRGGGYILGRRCTRFNSKCCYCHC